MNEEEYYNLSLHEQNLIDREMTQEEYDTSLVYRPSGVYSNFVTHSAFNPYITSIGLYNDEKELLAVGKLSRPIKKPKEYDISFTVRFDT